MIHLEDIQTAKNDTIKYFRDLTDYLERFDPVKLITHLTLTYLFYPGDEFKPEYDNIHKWSRWIELVSGYLATRMYDFNKEKAIDGNVLTELELKLEKYFNSLSKHMLLESLHNKTSKEEALLFHLKTNALYVRGDTYPHKQIELANSLYSGHSVYFLKKYGFNISEAIKITKAIKTEYERRINESRNKSKEEAEKLTNEQVENNQSLKSNTEELQFSNFCEMFFAHSDKLLSFSLDELRKFSNLPYDTCKGFLNRISQEFGYRNINYTNTFSDPFKAPFDYNTLYERPIIK